MRGSESVNYLMGTPPRPPPTKKEAEKVKRPTTQTFVFEAKTFLEFGPNTSTFCNYTIITIFCAFLTAAALASSRLGTLQNFQLACGLLDFSFLDCFTATVPTAVPPCYPLDII